jgi:Flp pilus assembly secretin CpaC
MLTAAASVACLAAGSGTGAAQSLDVNVGFAGTVKVDRKIDAIAIGDPGIAQANIAAGKVVVIVGKAPGMTHIIPLDEKGDEISIIVVTVTPYRTADDFVNISYNSPVSGSFFLPTIKD